MIAAGPLCMNQQASPREVGPEVDELQPQLGHYFCGCAPSFTYSGLSVRFWFAMGSNVG